MNVELVEEDRKDNELFFSIFDKDTGNIPTILPVSLIKILVIL